MSAELDRKIFTEIGILSYLKGKDINWIVQKFKDQAAKLSNDKKHEIRQKILSSDSMSNTASITGDLKVVLGHITYTYEDELSAVCLSTCKNYHQYHIKYVAEMISRSGSFGCQQCDINCQSTSQIILNAFVASYFQKIKNFQGSTLIFKRDKIGSMFKQEMERQAKKSQEKTVVPSKQDEGLYFIIQLKVLQIDSKDERLGNINNELLAQKLQTISTQDKSKQFEQRELGNASGQILMNLICFKTNVRIRNPLVHKNCKPCDHKNRLILFSYEQIYSLVTTKKKKIECIFPSCSNYFDQKNFDEVAVVVDNIHTVIYEQFRECIYGQYFAGMYQKNWHFNLAENMLLKNQKNKFLTKRYMDEVRRQVQSLLTTVNLAKKRKIEKKIAQDLEANRQLDQAIELSPYSKDEKIIVVNVDQSNICPVRCINCKNLNSKDMYRVAYHFKSNPDKKCPICDQQCKKTIFYDIYYLDLKQAQFLFLHGHNKEIYYDTRYKTYFHKLSFFTGRSMKEKLKQQNKVYKGNLYKGQMDIKLNKAIKYVPFMDRRCAENALAEEYNKHFIYIGENQKIKEETVCPHCKRLVRSDYLEYYEELESLLKANNNVLRWAARSQSQLFSINASILSIKYYNDITNQYRIKDQRKNIKFYWKNYEGTLIRFPVKFRGCTHPIQTAICDFSDILYQAKAQKATKFKCRWKQCKNEYSNAEQIERVSLDIYSKIEDDPNLMRKIVNYNQYWVDYNIEQASIVKTYRKFEQSNDEKTELEIIQKYRNKYSEGYQERKNRKEILEKLKRIEQQIEYNQQKLREDEESLKGKGEYRHSQNETEFQNLKSNSAHLEERRLKLLEQKDQMFKLEQEENRKLNKTNTINFTKLIKMYQPQVNKLKEKKNEEDPYDNLEEEDLSNYRTYGNLYPFKYAVPKTLSAEVKMKEVIAAIQERREGKNRP